MVGLLLAGFNYVKSDDNSGDGDSVGSNKEEVTLRPQGVLPPADTNSSPTNRAPSTNLERAPPTHSDISEPRHRGLMSVRRSQFYARTKVTNNSAYLTQNSKAMANGELTRANAMWQSGRVTKPNYQHICNQIHLHKQLVKKGRIELEAFQLAPIGTLMEQLAQQTNIEGKRPTREPRPRVCGNYGIEKREDGQREPSFEGSGCINATTNGRAGAHDWPGY